MKTATLPGFMAWLLACTLAIAAAGNALAAQSGGAQDALGMMKDTANQLLQDIRTHKSDYQSHPEDLYKAVNRVVLPHFDFSYMSQLVLGRYWRQATPDQRKRFTKAFKSLLVRTYANSLLEYSDARLSWRPLRGGNNQDEVRIRSQVSGSNLASPVPINYQVHKDNGQWKVYDVSVDGISLVTNYRSSYASIARSEGIDTLIRKLKQKAAQQAQNRS